MSAVSRQFEFALPGLTLSCGAGLERVIVRGHHEGPAEDATAFAARVDLHPADPGPESLVRRDAHAVAAVPSLRTGSLPDDIPTVLCVHALTADSRVGGPGGWWSDRVGPGRPIDTRLVRVLCMNNLGSCYGTTGPADAGFPRLRDAKDRWPAPSDGFHKGRFSRPADELPAPITTWDQARVLLAALDALGIHTVDVLVGGSVGGMVALALAALAPERFPAIVPIATLDHATPWIIGWNHIARQVLSEALARGEDGTDALRFARQLAHMTYRSNAGLMARHGRAQVGTDAWSANAPYRVQSYLTHQGDKLVRRFDPRSYLSQLDAMDHHDLATPPPPPDPHETWTRPPGPWPGLARITGRVDAVAIDTDELFFAQDLHAMVVRHRAHGGVGHWSLIRSAHGHDAFLMPSATLDDTLHGAIQRLDPERFP